MIKCNICISINSKRPKNRLGRHKCNRTCLDAAPSPSRHCLLVSVIDVRHVLRYGIKVIRKILCDVSHAATTQTYGF
jgi:hypothetical protein